jgi:hypothetical protein
LFGFIPLLPYIIAVASSDTSNSEKLPWICVGMTGVFLYVLGIVKAYFSDISMVKSGL